MPKTYSEEEKKHIIKRLKEEANNLMQEKGVKKTTVDELVKRVGIPKGTFYLFYPSKEMLLFDVAQDLHDQVDAHMEQGMRKLIMEKHISPATMDLSKHIEEITDIIWGAMQITYNSCLKVLLEPEAMAQIVSKLPDEAWEKHNEKHHNNNDILVAIVRQRGLDVQTVAGAFLMILFGGMYKREIGIDNWESSVRLAIKGLVLQLFG